MALIVLVYFAVSNIRTIPSTMNVVSEVREAVMDFPDFNLKSGKLKMEESFYYEDEESDTLIMTEPEYGSYINEYSLPDWRGNRS